jgi:hypothetical protein
MHIAAQTPDEKYTDQVFVLLNAAKAPSSFVLPNGQWEVIFGEMQIINTLSNTEKTVVSRNITLQATTGCILKKA